MENARDEIRAFGEYLLNERNEIGGSYHIFQHLDDSCWRACKVEFRKQTIHLPLHIVVTRGRDFKMREARSLAEP